MPWILLRTKVSIPALRSGLVERPHIAASLDGALQAGLRLALVSAPAGYGKTTALAQWAQSSSANIGWFTIDPEDNEFTRFFRYLVRAWERVQPDIMNSALGHLLGSINPDPAEIKTVLAQATAAAPAPTAIILNDYHLITEPLIHEALRFVIDHLPPHFHFILAVRGEPPLPLPRYRARGELLEIGTQELRFQKQETQELLGALSGLSSTVIESLHEQTEGWAVGLQLVSLALQRGLADPDQPAAVGRQRFVADFLRQEVLAQLPQDMVRFLLFTSLLMKLSGPLCEAVTAGAGGQEMLAKVENEGLFLTALDDRRQWFRYHTLFGDFLQQELQRRFPAAVAEIHGRAARWFLAAGVYGDAFHHALAAQDEETVSQIAEQRFELMLHLGQLRLLRRWLDRLPEAWQFRHPVIGLAEAGWLAMTGDIAACMQQVDRIEQALLTSGRPDQRWQLARVTVMRCQLACFQNNLDQAEPLAEKALQDLPLADQHYHANIHHSLGDAYRYAGRWPDARLHYEQALALVDDPAFRPRSIHVYGALADLELMQGRLRRAAAYWDQALAIIEERDFWGYLPLPLTGWVAIRKAEIAYQWNDRQQAETLVQKGLQGSEVGGVVQSLIVGYQLAGRLALARDDIDSAVSYLERARPLAEQSQFEPWFGRFQRLQVEISLVQEDLGAAARWAMSLLVGDGSPQKPHGTWRLALARALAAQPDVTLLDKGLRLLAELAQNAEEEGRMALQIEALALQALALDLKGQHAEALSKLTAALRRAEDEGYLRLFVDLGLPMARLLQEAQQRAVRPAYVARLLAAFDADWLATTTRPLPEPLTSREKEILELIAAGLTNREIGEKLFISPETVKKHAGNIYSKLNVSGRTEAVAVARKIGLLP